MGNTIGHHNWYTKGMYQSFWSSFSIFIFNSPLEYVPYLWKILVYHASKTPTVFCHNDLHGANIMISRFDDPIIDPIWKEGNYDPDSLQVIDFDNSEYGYRAFDFEYFLAKWPYPGPTDGLYTVSKNCIKNEIKSNKWILLTLIWKFSINWVCQKPIRRKKYWMNFIIYYNLSYIIIYNFSSISLIGCLKNPIKYLYKTKCPFLKVLKFYHTIQKFVFLIKSLLRYRTTSSCWKVQRCCR